MFRITQANIDAQHNILESLRKTSKSINETNKRRAIIQKENIADKKRLFYIDKIGVKIDKYGKTPDLLKEFRFFYNMTDEEIMAYNPPEEQSKKLKIGVKKINETEAAIKNQEKTIKSKKKQILNEQEYLNTMGKIMTGESNFIDNKGKWAVATELDVKDGLNPKIRRALKKSIIEQANKIKGTNIKGTNIKNKNKHILKEQDYLNNMGSIMSCKSELININGKNIVEISFNIKKELDPKIKRALKKSIIEQANFI